MVERKNRETEPCWENLILPGHNEGKREVNKIAWMECKTGKWYDKESTFI